MCHVTKVWEGAHPVPLRPMGKQFPSHQYREGCSSDRLLESQEVAQEESSEEEGHCVIITETEKKTLTEVTTVPQENIDFVELLLERGSKPDTDFARQAPAKLVHMIINVKVQDKTGTEHGEQSPAR